VCIVDVERKSFEWLHLLACSESGTCEGVLELGAVENALFAACVGAFGDTDHRVGVEKVCSESLAIHLLDRAFDLVLTAASCGGARLEL